MSLRLAQLQHARLGPRALGAAASTLADFLVGQLDDDGACRDRAGQPDLWYTAFALDALIALDRTPPRDPRPWLRGFHTGDGLDAVHHACLARCWAAVGGCPDDLRPGLSSHLHAPADTVYGEFLRLGATQDLGLPASGWSPADLTPRTRPDGGVADPGGEPTTPVTAAAVVLSREFGAPPRPASLAWLRARLHPAGGFVAAPGLPVPDLLSTAVALHALHVPERGLPPRIRDATLTLLDSFWTGHAFCASWADDEVDAEYAFYGLLALGHLT